MIHHPHRDHIEPIPHPLYIITPISNSQRWYRRYKHYKAFAKHMEESGVILYTGELALRDREFEITEANNPRHIRFRCNSELWHKENLINLVHSRLPPEAKYIGFFDADFTCLRPNWAYEALHMLQHYKFIQLFSSMSSLDQDYNLNGGITYGFVKGVKERLHMEFGIPQQMKIDNYNWMKWRLGAPGGAWAWRREAFDEVGGLLDICVLGSGDVHMATALMNLDYYEHQDINSGSSEYMKAIETWRNNAKEKIKGNVGYIDNHIIHHYHGSNKNRGYGFRPQILKKHDFNPNLDIKKDWQGIYNWTGNKPNLEEEVRQYFRSRNEDS